MAIVSYSPETIIYLKELVTLLYEKGYFGFPESAKEYVDKLTNDIEHNIGRKVKKVAPKYFSKYGKGMFYVTFQPNKRTTWYVFFIQKNDFYLIRYITNNHASGHFI